MILGNYRVIALNSSTIGKTLGDIIGQEEAQFLVKMFQVRHIFEHNMGVIDDDFIKKVSGTRRLKGRKYRLIGEEGGKFLDVLLEAGRKLEATINEGWLGVSDR